MADATGKRRVLVLCTGNSCRSQMAEGWVNHLLGATWEARSAGTAPAARVHPLAVRAMAEAGVDLAAGTPEHVRAYIESIAVLPAARYARRTPVKEDQMAVAKVSELSSTSTKSFEDALQQGIVRAHKTLRNVRSAWVKEQQVRVSNGAITEYQVNMMITFVLDE